jgi:hypothetical protein
MTIALLSDTTSEVVPPAPSVAVMTTHAAPVAPPETFIVKLADAIFSETCTDDGT